MNNRVKEFSPVQLGLLKKSAKALLVALECLKDPIANELLQGDLGRIIDEVIDKEFVTPFENIPHFEKMTRDYSPDVEAEYFNFYSLAMYGEPAYPDLLDSHK